MTRSLRAALYALPVVIGGCSTVEWVSLSDREIAEVILRQPPFDAPLSVEVERTVDGACSGALHQRSPDSWGILVEARLGTLSQVERPGGSFECVIKPARSAAKRGHMLEWRRSASGDTWHVPIGVYGIDGTNDEPILIERSPVGSRVVNFPWTFHTFTKLQGLVLSEKIASRRGLKGYARAEFARATSGWSVVALRMTPAQEAD